MGKRSAVSRPDYVGRVFETILNRAKQAGDFDRAEPILDYCHRYELADRDWLDIDLADSRFDFLPCLIIGVNGKLYLDCFLTHYNRFGQYSICVGTLQTLSADADSCKIMGELCGSLAYHGRQYLNEQRHCGLTSVRGKLPKKHRAVAGSTSETSQPL